MEYSMPNIFMVDLEGTKISALEKKILQHPNVGSLILFTRNWSDPAQLKDLINSVRSIRPDIFIAIDHEGGFVQRLQRQGFHAIPAAQVYGKAYDLNPKVGMELAQQYGQIMAQDLLAYGIDVSLAPILDVDGISNVIGKLNRAFHADPKTVETLAEAFIDGMHKAGMPAIGKHFPGHGSVSSDSHVTKPIYEVSETELKNHDLIPFIGLIAKNKLEGIMPAYVTYSSFDPHYAAGFSKIWLQKILREEFGFKGLVISDCLGMSGADIGDLHTRSLQALKAGCDILIISNQKREVLLEILNTLNFKQSDESVKRINDFTQKLMGSKALKPISGSDLATPDTKVEKPHDEFVHFNNTRMV
ncbi:MAG: beta-N-acetylhexosaminidase [Francisellaceae bacterium]|nr:beta-N-acetylhexosaminidase [Francisellaceae bacterium]